MGQDSEGNWVPDSSDYTQPSGGVDTVYMNDNIDLYAGWMDNYFNTEGSSGATSGGGGYTGGALSAAQIADGSATGGTTAGLLTQAARGVSPPACSTS